MVKRGAIARPLRPFKRIADHETLRKITRSARRLKGKHVVFINSTYQGGGVAELLNSMIPLFNELGIKVGWRTLHGSDDFFRVTKQFHNGLQGERVRLTKSKKRLYYSYNEQFALFSHFDHDLVVVHDPQPLPLIEFYPKKQPWIFRLHIDISQPNQQAWDFLSGFMRQYDRIIVSKEDYINPDLTIPYSVFAPCIDPFSVKNQPLSRQRIDKYIKKCGVSRKKPIISQISRFDKWKDPAGVIDVFERVRAERDCQLVLLGSLAADDPEGQQVYDTVRARADESPYTDDIHIVLMDSDMLVNALQRASDVVIQKSLREGFGLTISEALFKKTPVVASKVGGIPLQLIHGTNGFLHNPRDVKGFSDSILHILSDESLKNKFIKNGQEHVKHHFLMPRLMLDYLHLFEQYLL